MKTIKTVGILFQQSLTTQYSHQEIGSIFTLILSDLTGLSNAKLKAFSNYCVTVDQQNYLKDILLKLQTGEPVQYLLGKTEFYGLSFKVNSFVLIPRPETEELVDWLLNTLAGLSKKEFCGDNENLKILDIGTGSGCIAISLKKNIADAEVYALDISAEALRTARINASQNNVDVNFIHADILNTTSVIVLSKLSVIISNPPYVTPEDKMLMQPNVVDFEPHHALFVPQKDPLLFYRTIADFALGHLVKGGYLFLEINEKYGHETMELLYNKGFRDLELKQDMQDKDRMIKARL
ncbi:MAG: peptide chain release factor N(5)-glutamine methyltransferase [Sphingobacteriaceae bacterium]